MFFHYTCYLSNYYWDYYPSGISLCQNFIHGRPILDELQWLGKGKRVTGYQQCPSHDDVIKCKHFLRYWPFVRGNHRSPVNSPHKGQWRGALMLSLICAWINAWVNNREAGDLRRYRGALWRHCNVALKFIPDGPVDNEVSIGAGNGFVPSSYKPLHEPMLIKRGISLHCQAMAPGKFACYMKAYRNRRRHWLH